MDNPQTNPLPFILASYGIAGCLTLGYYLWTRLERRKWRAILAALEHSGAQHGQR